MSLVLFIFVLIIKVEFSEDSKLQKIDKYELTLKLIASILIPKEVI